MQSERYPKINIKSKNDLAKHISHKGFPFADALRLINKVLENHDKYWRDNLSQSNPIKEKYVRSAKGTPLGMLLEKINERVLAPHDALLPDFIFGGISERNHVAAAAHLLGVKRKRTLLKTDIERFFEKVSRERVEHLFQKCGCSKRAARLLARICCVPLGAKGSGRDERTIARGFATSSRLAVWSNLNIFVRLNELVKKELRGKNARLAVYVDDIGITASRVPKSEMERLYAKMAHLMSETDTNQRLPLHKTKFVSHEENPEHLGIRLKRSGLDLGNKSRGKKDHLREQLKKETSPEEKRRLRFRIASSAAYRRYVSTRK